MLNPERTANDRFIDLLARSPSATALSAALQPLVKRLYGALPIPIRDLLHGKQLGHSVHVVLTSVPLGAWTATAALDAADLCGAHALAPGADAALGVGLAGALGAAVTGFADWSDTSGEPRALGATHALLNSAAALTYGAALGFAGAGNRGARRTLAFFGYALVSSAAYLGGELSLGMQLAVKHTASPIFPPPDFVPTEPAVAFDALVDGVPKRVASAGIPLLLTRFGDVVSVVSATCTHRGAPLGELDVAGEGCVRCPWHGSRFALRDGSVVQSPATFPLARYESRIREGNVEVRPLQIGDRSSTGGRGKEPS